MEDCLHNRWHVSLKLAVVLWIFWILLYRETKINVTSTNVSFYFQSLWSKEALNTISISALISVGPEDTGCPSLSLWLQPLEGIWGHCVPLCCPAGSAVHRSLPAFTGFPVSGYHVLCLFSLLFVCVHPIGLVRHPTPHPPHSPNRACRIEDGTISAAKGGGGLTGVVNMHLHHLGHIGRASLLMPHGPAFLAEFFFKFQSLYQVDGKELHLPPPTTHPKQGEPQSIPN